MALDTTKLVLEKIASKVFNKKRIFHLKTPTFPTIPQYFPRYLPIFPILHSTKYIKEIQSFRLFAGKIQAIGQAASPSTELCITSSHLFLEANLLTMCSQTGSIPQHFFKLVAF